MPSIFLVEDHVIMSRMISRFLERNGNFTMWAVVQTAEEALDMLERADAQRAEGHGSFPDLMLVDVSLPTMNGIALVAILRRKYPNLPCLMLSGHDKTTYVRRALGAGARGYVTKDNPLLIVEGISRVLAGEIYLSENLRERDELNIQELPR